MSEDADEPTVPVDCPECETTTRVSIEEVAETVERHNDRLHDGEDVARVDPAISEQLADLVADDMGLLDESE
jgi:hypothetical protein